MGRGKGIVFPGQRLRADGDDAVPVMIVEKVSEGLLADGESSMLPLIGS
jgi:hypothetical protein